MRNVAAFLYGQLLLWCGSPIFQVAPVGGFVATHAVWVSPRNCQEVTKKPWRVEPPTIGLSLGYLAGNMPDAADAHNPCIGQDNGCPHPVENVDDYVPTNHGDARTCLANAPSQEHELGPQPRKGC